MSIFYIPLDLSLCRDVFFVVAARGCCVHVASGSNVMSESHIHGRQALARLICDSSGKLLSQSCGTITSIARREVFREHSSFRNSGGTVFNPMSDELLKVQK
jgi:hypothetical protein